MKQHRMGVIKKKRKEKQNGAFYARFSNSQGHINSFFCPDIF